jgi:glycosyltransferase involved in cell wall biosynthesis
MIKNKPLVTVIIPAYNSSINIEECISSVINQIYENIEILIIDDGSTDDTKNIVQNIIKKESRIKYYYQENQGSPTAKNYGLTLANGKYIQFLDSDDILSMDKIENQIALLDGSEDNICVCKTVAFNNEINNIGELVEIDTEYLDYTSSPIDFLLNLIGSNGRPGMVQPNAYLTPTKVIHKAGFWSQSLNRSPDDDSEFFCRVILNCDKIIYDSKSINYYRKSLNLLSSGKSLEHAKGALKTVELKAKYILTFSNTLKTRSALIQSIAKVAYIHGLMYPEIILNVKLLLNQLFNLKKIPPTGGVFFLNISRLIGFENSMKLKKILKYKI